MRVLFPGIEDHPVLRELEVLTACLLMMQARGSQETQGTGESYEGKEPVVSNSFKKWGVGGEGWGAVVCDRLKNNDKGLLCTCLLVCLLKRMNPGRGS